MKRIDETGNTHGYWKVLSFHHIGKNRESYWLCRCRCGTVRPVTRTHLVSGATKSCGCFQREVATECTPIETRFWKLVNKSGPTIKAELGPCWVWTGSHKGRRYGSIRVADKNESAHRVAWFLATGKWPNPFALHKCDNTFCVRFSHLFEGDQTANMKDMARKERCSNTKLTMEDVKSIRIALNSGTSPTQIAHKYKVTRAVVSDIKVGKTWPDGYIEVRSLRSDNSTGFQGVLPHGHKWRADIKGQYLGLFPTAEQAALAYDAMARELFGESAYTNFKETK